jgi:hypothetical protein
LAKARQLELSGIQLASTTTRNLGELPPQNHPDVVAYLMGWRPENLNLGGSRERRGEKAPLDILKERYARGEITKEEYERMRADLER